MKILILCVLALGGCFAEITGGAYVVKDESGLRSGYGAGAAVGVFLDPGSTRVAVGGGADFVHRRTEDTESWNAGGGVIMRVDAPVAPSKSPFARTTLIVGYGGGGVGLRPRSGGEYTSDPEARGWHLFVGATTGFQANALGVWASLGPSVVRTRSDMAGDMFAAGPQLRIMITGKLPGLGALIANSNYVGQSHADVAPKPRDVGTCVISPYHNKFCY